MGDDIVSAPSPQQVIRQVGNFPARQGDRTVRMDPASGHFIQFLDFRGGVKAIPFQMYKNMDPGNVEGPIDYNQPLGPWFPEGWPGS